MSHSEPYTRNLKLYPWFAGVFNAFFWMPVFFLYFSRILPIEQVLLLEAIYYGSVVILEVPSGFFSDTVGRKITLVIASLSLAASYLLFSIGDSFAVFAIAQILMASGIAFVSGTDTSFHYDSLQLCGLQKEYGDREAKITRIAFTAGAIAAVTGGIAAVFDLRLAYVLSFGSAMVMFVISLFFTEPAGNQGETQKSSGFAAHIILCLGYLRQSRLRWLFIFAVLMITFNHVPYEFYQPYVQLVSVDVLNIDLSDGTPLATGAHLAITMLLASLFAPVSIKLTRKLGIFYGLLVGMLLLNVIISFTALFLNPLVALLLLLRNVPRALMTAPLNEAVTPQLPKHLRATYLSLQSLTGRLGFSVLLIILSLITGTQASSEWHSISSALKFCSVAGVIGMAALLVAIPKKGR